MEIIPLNTLWISQRAHFLQYSKMHTNTTKQRHHCNWITCFYLVSPLLLQCPVCLSQKEKASSGWECWSKAFTSTQYLPLLAEGSSGLAAGYLSGPLTAEHTRCCVTELLVSRLKTKGDWALAIGAPSLEQEACSVCIFFRECLPHTRLYLSFHCCNLLSCYILNQNCLMCPATETCMVLQQQEYGSDSL